MPGLDSRKILALHKSSLNKIPRFNGAYGSFTLNNFYRIRSWIFQMGWQVTGVAKQPKPKTHKVKVRCAQISVAQTRMVTSATHLWNYFLLIRMRWFIKLQTTWIMSANIPPSLLFVSPAPNLTIATKRQTNDEGHFCSSCSFLHFDEKYFLHKVTFWVIV